MPQAALIIGAVASVAGTVVSMSEQRKAARLSRQQQQVATRRSRRQAIRASQISRAQAVASAQATGSLGSSGAAGGIGSVSSRLGEALGFSTQMSGLSRDISSAQQRAATWGGIASLGGSLFSYGQSRGATFSNPEPNRPPQFPGLNALVTRLNPGVHTPPYFDYGRSGQPQ